MHELFVARLDPDKLTLPEPAAAVAVPPQVLASPLGVATTNPAGRLSVKATPVSAMLLLTGLVIVKLSEVEPFKGILAAPKALTIVGGVATERLAVAELPVPPFVELTAPVVFTKFPDVVAVMLTTTVQEVCAAMEPPVSEMLPEPATAVAVPPHVLDSPLGVATTSPTGNVSVNAVPVSATELAAGLVSVNVRGVVPFSGTAAAPKALAMDGGATTLMLADAVPPAPPSLEFTFPVVLFCVPAAMPVTFTEKVQELLGASVAPARLMTFVPCADVMVPPPQLPASPFGLEITKPAGNVSLNAVPVRVVAALLF